MITDPEPAPVYLSAIDEQRFAIRTARAPCLTLDTLSLVLDFCNTNRVALLIARCPASELNVAQAMEKMGFFLMDTLVYYSRKLDRPPIPKDPGHITVRPLRPGEEEAIRRVALESFRGYLGHYHADERLDPDKCDEVYPDWAFRSCLSRDLADEVLVAELEGEVVGFATLRLNSAEEGEGILFGVSPSAQGLGIYRSFMISGMEWCLSRGAKRMVVSTQLTNLAVQKSWTRLGFELDRAYYTFHKWFDSP